MGFQLTANEQALLPSDEDVRFYRKHGWYVSKPIFTDAEIEAVVAAADGYYAGDRVAMPGGSEMPWGWKPEHGDTLRKNDWSSLQNPGIMNLIRKPLLGAVGAKLAGTKQIRLWHDQLLWKPVERPGKQANVGWHTDRGYWKTCTSANMLTAWIPFHDCDDVIGGISFVDRSNHWPDNTENLNFFSNDLEGLEKNFVTGGAEIKKIVPFIKKGCCTFHHCLTIHGSGANRSNRERRSLAVHLQDETNRFRPFPLKDGKLAAHGNDMFDRKNAEGHPDYTDPALHPVLWQE